MAGKDVFLETSLVVATLTLERQLLVISSWQLAHDEPQKQTQDQNYREGRYGRKENNSLMTGKNGDFWKLHHWLIR